jgi:hypothetical protein
MSNAVRKEITPKGGGSASLPNKPVKAYMSLKFMKEGEEFRGIFRGSYTRSEVDPKSGLTKERTSHYFSASNAGKVRKLDKYGEAVITEYAAGDKVVINGTVKLNDILSQIQRNDIVLLIKKGTIKNKKSEGETQDLTLFVEGNAGPELADAPAAADDNDDVNF